MQAIDSNVVAQYQSAKGTRQEKIDLGKLPVGSKIKVVAESKIPFFLEVTIPSEGRVHLICDSGSKEVRQDIANADLGQRLIYCFSAGSMIPSRSVIEEGNQLWFDTFLCVWIKELFLLE